MTDNLRESFIDNVIYNNYFQNLNNWVKTVREKELQYVRESFATFEPLFERPVPDRTENGICVF